MQSPYHRPLLVAMFANFFLLAPLSGRASTDFLRKLDPKLVSSKKASVENCKRWAKETTVAERLPQFIPPTKTPLHRVCKADAEHPRFGRKLKDLINSGPKARTKKQVAEVCEYSRDSHGQFQEIMAQVTTDCEAAVTLCKKACDPSQDPNITSDMQKICEEGSQALADAKSTQGVSELLGADAAKCFSDVNSSDKLSSGEHSTASSDAPAGGPQQSGDGAPGEEAGDKAGGGGGAGGDPASALQGLAGAAGAGNKDKDAQENKGWNACEKSRVSPECQALTFNCKTSEHYNHIDCQRLRSSGIAFDSDSNKVEKKSAALAPGQTPSRTITATDEPENQKMQEEVRRVMQKRGGSYSDHGSWIPAPLPPPKKSP